MSVKLNLGCGVYKVEGWTNIDSVPELKPDLLLNIEDLPALQAHFQAGTVDEIYAGHVLEHLTDPMATLRGWHNLLRPDGEGVLSVVMPDHAKTVELWTRADRFPVLTESPLVGLISVTTGFIGWNNYRDMASKNPDAAKAQTHHRSIDLPVLWALLEFGGFKNIELTDETQLEAAPRFAEPVTWQMCVRCTT